MAGQRNAQADARAAQQQTTRLLLANPMPGVRHNDLLCLGLDNSGFGEFDFAKSSAAKFQGVAVQYFAPYHLETNGVTIETWCSPGLARNEQNLKSGHAHWTGPFPASLRIVVAPWTWSKATLDEHPHVKPFASARSCALVPSDSDLYTGDCQNKAYTPVGK